MNRYIIFKLPIYRQWIAFVQTNDKAWLNEHFDIEFSSEDELYAHCFPSVGLDVDGVGKMNTIVVIINPYDEGRTINAATLAHEMLHVTYETVLKVGAKPSAKNPEYECYLLETLMEMAVDFFSFDNTSHKRDMVDKNVFTLKSLSPKKTILIEDEEL